MSNDHIQNAKSAGGVIPKEQMTAYQRWELSSFDQPNSGHKNASNLSPEALALAQQKGHEEGFSTGHQMGYDSGYQTGYEAGIARAREEAALMDTLLQNLQQGLNQMDEQISQSLVALSISIAKKMVRETTTFRPEIIFDIIKDAISTLPQFNQNAHVVLHPLDAELVRKHMGDELAHAGWKIFTDEKLERGGCLVKTAHSFIDATSEECWKRVLNSIGQDQSWIA